MPVLSQGIIWSGPYTASLDVWSESGRHRFVQSDSDDIGPKKAALTGDTSVVVAEQWSIDANLQYQIVECLDVGAIQATTGQRDNQQFRSTVIPGGRLRGNAHAYIARLIKVGYEWYFKDNPQSRLHMMPKWTWSRDDLLKYAVKCTQAVEKSSEPSKYKYFPEKRQPNATEHRIYNNCLSVGGDLSIRGDLVTGDFNKIITNNYGTMET